MSDATMIRATSVSTAVADELRKEIIGGARNAGEQLPGNRELAARYGVSMGSVREAISMLSAEGLIETRAGRGTYVAAGANLRLPTPVAGSQRLHERKYIEELIEAREILEMKLVVLAAQRASDDQIAELEGILKRMEEAIHEPALYAEADVQFHLAMAEAAGNRVLSEAMRNIRASLKREMELSAEVGARRHGDLRFSADSHRRVLNAIKAGDPELARSEMFDIMSRHHEFVLSMYRDRG
jgi:DNA-binding FadR family transcriptional regulator